MRPKSTIEVGGKPIIRRTVEMLAARGIKVAVVLGYEGDFIRGCLDGCDVRFYENPFYSETNSLGSLWMAREFLSDGEDALVMNADVYWDDKILDWLME